MAENPTNPREVAEEIKRIRSEIGEKINELSEKEGFSQEEIDNEIGIQLYTSILEVTGKILEDEKMLEQFKIAAETIDKPTLTALTSIIAVTASNAAFQAVIFHDGLLKEELTEQFDNFVNHINNDKREIGMLKARMQVIEKKLDELIMKITTQNISKEINE